MIGTLEVKKKKDNFTCDQFPYKFNRMKKGKLTTALSYTRCYAFVKDAQQRSPNYLIAVTLSDFQHAQTTFPI